MQTIRPATPADAPLILSLIRALAVYEHLEHEVVADEAAIHEILFGPTAVAEALIAERDGAAVGYALFHYTVSTFLGKRTLYLEDLFVQPHARGQGLGRALLAAVAKVAVERKCGRLNWAVLDWNAPSIAFYESLGGRMVDSWRIFDLSGDALQALAEREK